ncbi:DUF1740-domain-containing protein [Durotheca rogersii]|uniref:DUF1740-domain-containing protein n=1 Tax=Durotheca rogersii TaxID=419775 RepID=UPI00221F8D48|nr:DUF1740-domain-containing protein [Durotheca rogersii]KAI5863211.1 DUF1740-domain-containing protein [Durotheca rogersii]
MSPTQSRSLAVPRFSSFKPKPEAIVRGSGENQHDEDLGEAGAHRTPARPRHHSSAADIKVPHRPSPPEQGKDALFITDSTGDPLIRRYGCNNRRDIPGYRRFGSGRILGIDGYMRIDKTRSQDEFFLQGRGESRSLLGSDKKAMLAKGGHSRSQPVRVRQQQAQTVTGSEDFVPLGSSRKRKRDGDEPGGLSSGEEPSYRSINGKSKNHEHSDSDVDYDSDASAGLVSGGVEDPVSLRTIELSKKVGDHPQDIDGWLELVDHQNILQRISAQNSRQPTPAEVKSFADIKLSLLEQAYSHASTRPQQEHLQLRIMREGGKVWDDKTLLRRWDAALEKHGTNFEIWKQYTNFRQTRLSTFEYDKIKQLYVARLRLLESEAMANQARPQPCRVYEQMIYVFLRATRFISDAGYRELATAAWQATLEMTFSRPSALREQSGFNVPTSFQDFWESEVPRLGEESASGWETFDASGAPQEPPEPKSSVPFTPPNTRDGYKAWSLTEQHRARVAINPARTLDDGADDDPFRVAMFADIQDIILYIPTEAIPSVRCQLLDAFLIFCQLPPALCSAGIVQDMLQDDFLLRNPGSPVSMKSRTEPIAGSEDQTKDLPDFSPDYQRLSITPDVLFPPPNWFQGINRIRDTVPPHQYQWISVTLKQLVYAFDVRQLAPYYLAFESVNEPGNEKKTAKRLLKQDSGNIGLYLGYSMIEWAKGNKAVARNTAAAAMEIANSPHSWILLCTASVWMELEDRNLARGILLLCALSDEGAPVSASASTAASTAHILKARQFFRSFRDDSLTSGEPENAVLYAEGLALLEYMTQQSGREPSSGSQGDIWSAISSITVCSDELVSRGLGSSPAHERLLQSAAHLLYYHASQGPYRPGYLREQLEKYVCFFPRNTIFLALFSWREARLSIDDRVRSILDKAVLVEQYDCVTSRVFAIRYESRTGNIHSTRAAYEHALASDACKNHPDLWISYLRFCHERKELRPKAKSVFYRALQFCPWSKDVFMEAFVTLVRDMDSSELRSVYNMLCEKGLRVHAEMDEFVEKWRRDQKARDRIER